MSSRTKPTLSESCHPRRQVSKDLGYALPLLPLWGKSTWKTSPPNKASSFSGMPGARPPSRC